MAKTVVRLPNSTNAEVQVDEKVVRLWQLSKEKIVIHSCGND